MGRRSFISTSAINSLLSHLSANKSKRERENLIRSQSSSVKELPIHYSLENVEFNDVTRIAKITFKGIKQYRTIDRYVTQNYQKYPIYSEWKTKINYIDKTIKLNNLTLENLNSHSENLICEFAEEIIFSLNNQELIPSWLARKIISNELSANLAEEEQKRKDFKDTSNSFQCKQSKAIQDINCEIASISYEQQKIEKKILKKEQTIFRIDNHKKSILLSIVTFSIYNLLNSKKRKCKIDKKRIELISQLNNIKTRIQNCNKKINSINQNINNEKAILNKHFIEIDNQILHYKKIYDEQNKQVCELSSVYNEEMDYISLKHLLGLEYEKIVGCYIIYNTEKDKHYIGQSKDVIKRIRQHFKGTVPNNIIFAEDYFSSQLEDKSKIFNVKIIRLQTKDELDSTEKELIKQYDANHIGYNSTKGNI